ncbi:MAG: NAD-dependent epimerase/dehydratase family protein, partial [Xanthomonadaceae bacterium]|nr:NAD-dependent epimerase/dehydratase family protein [Xanthomonadaceae bacterium]
LDMIGVTQIHGDLANAEAVRAACASRDAVFHNAAKAGAWGAYADYHCANVIGTQNVLDACRAQGIARLVYTSTPSVTHRAGHAVEGGNEIDTPYGDPFRAAYPTTKAIAERAVLAANGVTLATIALRPRLIWGPGDPHLLPGLVARARAGRLRLIDGGGNRIDTTYVDNAAQAHVDAFDHLWPGSACSGKAYFISNGEPRPLRDIVNALLCAADAPQVSASIPYRLAYGIGAACELAWRSLPLRGEPPLTRFLAEQLATPHWYDISAAERDFGYHPRISLDEGFSRLAQ